MLLNASAVILTALLILTYIAHLQCYSIQQQQLYLPHYLYIQHYLYLQQYLYNNTLLLSAAAAIGIHQRMR